VGGYSTKEFFIEKLEGFKDKGFNFFEIAPAPDCCPTCKSKANKKIKIKKVQEKALPPFHEECRCDILPLDDDEGAVFFKTFE